jgi:hypothetical protein
VERFAFHVSLIVATLDHSVDGMHVRLAVAVMFRFGLWMIRPNKRGIVATLDHSVDRMHVGLAVAFICQFSLWMIWPNRGIVATLDHSVDRMHVGLAVAFICQFSLWMIWPNRGIVATLDHSVDGTHVGLAVAFIFRFSLWMIRPNKRDSKLCACSTRHTPNGRLSAAVVAQHGKGLRPVASPAAGTRSQQKAYSLSHSAVGDE